MMRFNSKLVNDGTYSKNGQVVEVLEYLKDGIFAKIKFNDGTIATVYRAELTDEY